MLTANHLKRAIQTRSLQDMPLDYTETTLSDAIADLSNDKVAIQIMTLIDLLREQRIATMQTVNELIDLEQKSKSRSAAAL